MRVKGVSAQDELDLSTLPLQWAELGSSFRRGRVCSPGDGQGHCLPTVSLLQRRNKEGQGYYTQGALRIFLSCGGNISQTYLFMGSFYHVESRGAGKARNAL